MFQWNTDAEQLADTLLLSLQVLAVIIVVSLVLSLLAAVKRCVCPRKPSKCVLLHWLLVFSRTRTFTNRLLLVVCVHAAPVSPGKSSAARKNPPKAKAKAKAGRTE